MAARLETVNTADGPRPLLYVAFRFKETFAGRFSARMPAPIFVVAVNRASGLVYIRELTRDDDPEVSVRPAGAAPKAVWRVEGKVVEGPEVHIGGTVTVNLMAHLGLPQVPAVYDTFLWIDEYATDPQVLEIGGEPRDIPETTLHRKADSVVTVQPAQVREFSARLVTDPSRRPSIQGASPGGKVTVLAVSALRRRIGWARFRPEEDAGSEFTVRTADLIDGLEPEERVVAFVLADGKRSALLDTAHR